MRTLSNVHQKVCCTAKMVRTRAATTQRPNLFSMHSFFRGHESNTWREPCTPFLSNLCGCDRLLRVCGHEHRAKVIPVLQHRAAAPLDVHEAILVLLHTVLVVLFRNDGGHQVPTFPRTPPRDEGGIQTKNEIARCTRPVKHRGTPCHRHE